MLLYAVLDVMLGVHMIIMGDVTLAQSYADA